MRPAKECLPHEWGASNRVYPPTSGLPGPRNPYLTPYTIDFSAGVARRSHKKVVLVMFSQGGKSEAILDIIGRQMDVSPIPILYLGPTQQFIREQWRPRIDDLIEQSKAIRDKVARKGNTTSRINISGVPLRLAHAGSTSAVKSDPFGLALTDEVEELLKNIKRGNNPLRLVEERGKTYSDFVHAMTSTPGYGLIDTEKDEKSGLEFWSEAEPEQVESVIWREWQSGTRHHFAIPCVHCGEFFIPRLSMLKWDRPKMENGKPGRSTTELARATAHVDCPSCGAEIVDDEKTEGSFKQKGVMVAPGQRIVNGRVTGSPRASETLSYWVSGLCNPFETWSDIAAKLVDAENSGQPQDLADIYNGTGGECFAVGGGSAPLAKEIWRLRDGRDRGTVPDWSRRLILTVDVQGDRLEYVLRAWGAKARSALVDEGEFYGNTANPEVWDALSEYSDAEHDGHRIDLEVIDAGFNPSAKEPVPQNRVYEYCAKRRRRRYPARGVLRGTKKVVKSKPEVDRDGSVKRYGLTELRISTDQTKLDVYERVRWPKDRPGSWTVHDDIDMEYCRQVASEARVVHPGGRVEWVKIFRDNHKLDAEAMQFAAAWILNVHKIPETSASPDEEAQHDAADVVEAETEREVTHEVPSVQRRRRFAMLRQ